MKELKFRLWNKIEKEMIYFNLFSLFNILDFEVMQYTGLKDSEGKRIYEGDIIKTKEDVTLEVYWCEDGFWDTDKGGLPVWELVNYKENCQIIGNIYENPELLREENVVCDECNENVEAVYPYFKDMVCKECLANLNTEEAFDEYNRATRTDMEGH